MHMEYIPLGVSEGRIIKFFSLISFNQILKMLLLIASIILF